MLCRLHQVKFWEGGDPPPCFTIDGVNYIYVRKNGLLFAVSTQWNVSPSMFLELLNRLAKVFKDYCGVLSEVRAGGRFSCDRYIWCRQVRTIKATAGEFPLDQSH